MNESTSKLMTQHPDTFRYLTTSFVRTATLSDSDRVILAKAIADSLPLQKSIDQFKWTFCRDSLKEIYDNLSNFVYVNEHTALSEMVYLFGLWRHHVAYQPVRPLFNSGSVNFVDELTGIAQIVGMNLLCTGSGSYSKAGPLYSHFRTFVSALPITAYVRKTEEEFSS